LPGKIVVVVAQVKKCMITMTMTMSARMRNLELKLI